MRPDSIGLFWEDLPSVRSGRTAMERPMPEVPFTGWVAPTNFPNLAGAKRIALDVETYDPELKERGPGWARGRGHLVGASLAVDGGYRWYFPIRHETNPEQNINPEQVLRYLSDTLGNSSQRKIGANIIYDCGWLRQEGVIVKGDLFDVQFAEALLDESAEVNLDALMLKYLGIGKKTELLYQWLADWFGGAPTSAQRKHIYRAPPSLVGPYAEVDADGPLNLEYVLTKRLADEQLWDIFQLECSLINMLIDMRFAGVSVNVPEAERVRDVLLVKESDAAAKIRYVVGFDVNVNSSSHLAKAFDSVGILYPKTDTGRPSFKKDWLEEVDHPLAEAIMELRKLSKLRSTFLESYIINDNINGKIYGQFHLLRGDDDGTRSGRLSATDPNLQNIPSKDKVLAPLVRGVFIPDPGHKSWGKFDLSQIEYRFLAHFAVGPKSDEIRQIFVSNPEADYHQAIIDLIYAQTGIKLDRKPAKTINFGLIYGMGKDKLGHSLHLNKRNTTHLFDAYHEGAPFARATMAACSDEALSTGIVKTVLGRRSRFDLWEPGGRGKNEKSRALPLREALYLYGANIRRAYAHKALNRKLQGSAADFMKTAMLNLYRSGVFAYTGIPRITVHDELDFSDPGAPADAWQFVKHTFETALPLKVPILADYETGPDWGHVG